MQALPHHYTVTATGKAKGSLSICCDGLEDIQVSPPAQFGGPGDEWSPEDLLMSAVSSCFIFSFRAITAASKFDWVSIECEATGVLDKVERSFKFTDVTSVVKLVIAEGTSVEKAALLLQKAEDSCLINNSLSANCHLEFEIITE